jgi:glycosyltransferase involved in cell wall biosynthesis
MSARGPLVSTVRRDAATPLVSIVIPSYNHARYVGQALQSVYSQTYRAIEVIVIDDGSRDGSLGQIQAASVGAPFPTKVVPQENRGAHAAINAGIALAQGDFVNVLNSDDYFSPQRIERFVRAFETYPGVLGFSRVACVDETGTDIDNTNEYARTLCQKQSEIGSFPTVGFSLLDYNRTISTGNMFIRRAAFAMVGLFRDYVLIHDWDFVLRSLWYSEPYFLDEPTYYYRVHGNNTIERQRSRTRDEGHRMFLDYFRSIRAGRPVNPVAPSPCTWPHFFEFYLDRINLDSIYRQVA